MLVFREKHVSRRAPSVCPRGEISRILVGTDWDVDFEQSSGCSRQHSDDAVRQASDLTIGAAGEGDVVFGRFSFDFEFEPQFDRW